ncbi:hypothetical protein GCM10025858_32320 [Alicyclobacillus sacchari]|nr:hypothetical protein GCM10025858_32320 [Alicyclobacillus sacchari]
MKLDGATFIVTGGGSGLGEATARAFAEAARVSPSLTFRRIAEGASRRRSAASFSGWT